MENDKITQLMCKLCQIHEKFADKVTHKAAIAQERMAKTAE